MRDNVFKAREYDRDLQELHIFAAGDDYITTQLQILAKNAKYGIASPQKLQQEFAALQEKSFKNSLIAKQDKSIFTKVALQFTNIIHVRKIVGAEDSNKTDDIIARAGVFVASNHFEQAILELKKLSLNDAKLLHDWQIKAQDYVNATAAAESVLRYTTRPVSDIPLT